MDLDYSDQLVERPLNYDGIESLTWVKGDTGAWDGPLDDWRTSHVNLYLDNTPGRNVVITAGGNCGMYTKFYSKIFKAVYAFEPDPLNFHCLVTNNQVDNVVKFQCALGDTHELIRVRRNSMQNVGTHTVEKHPDAIIPQMRIDDLDLPYCDLIQLDVEGYEINILHGAFATIRKHYPTIIAENGDTGTEVYKHLTEVHGYHKVGQSKSDTVFTHTNE